MNRVARLACALCAAALPVVAEAQQVVDTTFAPPVREPAFAPGRGPRVVVDEAHRNFHSAVGRYRPFARLVEADGFRVERGRAPFDSASLAGVDVLVIANALGAGHEGAGEWKTPAVSAFGAGEIDAVVSWIRRGGALLLIADHMPFAGDAAALAAPLGIAFLNGFALLGDADGRTGDYPITFRRGDGTLRDHPLVRAHATTPRIDSLQSFTGSAFRLTDPATARAASIMALPRETRVLLPSQAWQFTDATPIVTGDDLLQGAAFAFGRGRVAVFGEAAMFSAQRKGPGGVPMGMNAPGAAENPRFVLNIVRWLATGR